MTILFLKMAMKALWLFGQLTKHRLVVGKKVPIIAK